MNHNFTWLNNFRQSRKLSSKEGYSTRIKVLNHSSGFVVLMTAFFILIIAFSIALSMSSLIFYRQRISTDSIKSTQSFYAAEAGIEDALMLLKDNSGMSPVSYTLQVATGVSTNVTIPAVIGGSRTVISQGDSSNLNRKIQAVYSLDSEEISFNYGVHIGAGGLIMNNGSLVKGNLFSNGNVTGSGTIENNVIIATNGNKIDGPHVQGNVLSYSCENSTVDGNLIYVTGGSNTCSVGGDTNTQSGEITSQPLPISDAQISDWKAEALGGGTSGDVTVSGTQSLGPKKIIGKLTLNNNAILNVTGTLHVTDEIVLNNNSTIKLDSSYGSLGGIVISDGKITLNNGSSALGSGQSGSYMLMLSTNTDDLAIKINNNGVGGIFYTTVGGIELNNNSQVKELTGYKIKLSNNTTIIYESGLQDSLFTGGPGGSWKVVSWGEVN